VQSIEGRSIEGGRLSDRDCGTRAQLSVSVKAGSFTVFARLSRLSRLFRVSRHAPVAALILLGAGCANLPAGDPEEIVRRQATDFAAAVRAAEFEEAYDMTTPAYRSVTRPDRFASEYAGAPNWLNAEVSTVACGEQRCEVRLLITYRLMRPAIENTRPIDQVWVQSDGKWYLYPDS
jgi:hypothetical protein